MKTLFILILSGTMVATAYAQSTCEARVDAHQKATTTQRVAYCLTPDTVPADGTYSELVYSQISAPNVQPQQQQSVRLTTKPGRFDPEKVSVARSYVATAQFPQLGGEDTTYTVAVDSEQALGTNQALQEKSMTVSTTTDPSQTGLLTPVEHFMSDEIVSTVRSMPVQEPVETKAGLKTRQTKPNRYAKTTLAPAAEQMKPAENETQLSSQPGNAAQPAGVVNGQASATQSDLPETIVDDLYTEIPATETQTPATLN